MGCVNCGREGRGRERRLRFEGDRERRLSLCEECLDELLEEEWIEQLEMPADRGRSVGR